MWCFWIVMIVYGTQKNCGQKTRWCSHQAAWWTSKQFTSTLVISHVNSAPCHGPDTKNAPNEMFERGQWELGFLLGFLCIHFISSWKNLSFLFPCWIPSFWSQVVPRGTLHLVRVIPGEVVELPVRRWKKTWGRNATMVTVVLFNHSLHSCRKA